MREDLPYWLGLLRYPKFGPVRMARLQAAFPTNMRDAFSASMSVLMAAGIEPAVAEGFILERSSINPTKEFERVQAAGLRAITRLDEDYPKTLLTLYDPPAVLFVRGNLPVPDRRLLAVVGSRQATSYGLETTRLLTKPLAEAGVGIVSGLAYGIDAASHEAALEVGGYTMAVLGGGVDEASIYPSQHRALAARIVTSGGAVLSEYLPGTASLKYHFPIRNRIIAGLCAATLVVEAAEKSGSLITAREALESGRDVFAVPGPITSPLSNGPHALIRSGALCVTCANDMLEVLGLAPAPKICLPTFEPADADEAAVYKALSNAPQHIDDLVEATHLSAPKISSILTKLDLAGHAHDAGGLHFVKT